MADTDRLPSLHAAIGTYPTTEALKSRTADLTTLRFDFAEASVISHAFAPMVRQLRYDISEMAIATFLQARAAKVPLVLLPVVMAARFQQSALLCRQDSSIRSPSDLIGRRVGVRAYSQTTGMWLRGIMMEEGGPRPEQIRWTTFEDAHVAGVQDPPWAERASPGQEMLAMLKAGALDAVIVGNDVPKDPALRTVWADPDVAAAAFWRRHHIIPVNHMVVVQQSLLQDHPGLAKELIRAFALSATRAQPGLHGAFPAGRQALKPVLTLALRYMNEQGMLPYPLTLEDVWEGLPEDVE